MERQLERLYSNKKVGEKPEYSTPPVLARGGRFDRRGSRAPINAGKSTLLTLMHWIGRLSLKNLPQEV